MTIPELNEGERYLCGIVSEDGTVTHTILLPGDNDDANWHDQMDWAKSIGGDLLSCPEQAVALEKMPEEFKKDLYWSNKQHASVSGSAWCQAFFDGSQYYSQRVELRARAVRRVFE